MIPGAVSALCLSPPNPEQCPQQLWQPQEQKPLWLPPSIKNPLIICGQATRLPGTRYALVPKYSPDFCFVLNCSSWHLPLCKYSISTSDFPGNVVKHFQSLLWASIAHRLTHILKPQYFHPLTIPPFLWWPLNLSSMSRVSKALV